MRFKSNVVTLRQGRRLKSLPKLNSRPARWGERPAPSRFERRLQSTLSWFCAACAVVIAVAMCLMFPDTPQKVSAALRDPVMDLAGPYRNCAAAHAAGFYSIPAGSPAYSPYQDGDNDGYACEPIGGGGPEDGGSRIARKLASKL